MSRIVKKNFEDIRRLSTIRRKEERRQLLNKNGGDLVFALCEIIQNVLKGNVKLSPSEIKKLKRYHRAIYDIVEKKTSLKRRKQLLVQEGGFLMTLLPPAIALLATILNASR